MTSPVTTIAVPQTVVAQGLYRTLGFQEIAPYYANPVPGTKFFALPLPFIDKISL
ncbi:MAG: hypothetical protein V4713_02975 [Pseudomonadota bacterium]